MRRTEQQFAVDLAHMTTDQLVILRERLIEIEGEEENHKIAGGLRRMVELLDAMGNWLYPVAFEDALARFHDRHGG